ncbi:MAG TPA: hypothetical protein VFA45_09170 [Actinomycetes bacterium]|nr:hypothetical protein [Actinomycetes bacterium]
MTERTSTDWDRDQAERMDRMDRAGRMDRGGRGGDQISGWAVGGAIFAAVLMMVVGAFQVIAGITAIIKDQFFVTTPNYILTFDLTGWGIIHLIFGALLVVAGWFVLRGNVWARAVAIALVALSAIANFLFLPYYPLWAILVIAIDVFVIWALATYGRRPAAY